MIGYQVLPVEGVPLDVNTITFLINPAYTMAGSLDGLTGSRATSDRFFRHVPEMRSQFGSLYPASYFRLKEAYDLKTQIDEQDKLHQAYFNQFNAGLVDETSLNRQVNDSSRDGGAVGVNSADRSGGESNDAIKELDQKIEAKKKEIDRAEEGQAGQSGRRSMPSRKNWTICKKERKNNAQAGASKAGEERQSQINSDPQRSLGTRQCFRQLCQLAEEDGDAANPRRQAQHRQHLCLGRRRRLPRRRAAVCQHGRTLDRWLV